MKKSLAFSIVSSLALATAASATSVSVTGPGGPLSDAPYGFHAWNTAPTWGESFTINVPTPVLSVEKVTLQGFTFDYRGELHVYLTDPNNVRYNLIVRPGYDGSTGGDNGAMNLGNYDIVPSGGASLAQGAAAINGGTYNQFLNTGSGAWTSGTYVINNTAMPSIAGPAGFWTLTIVDWISEIPGFAFASSMTSWTLTYLSGPPGTTYCEPGTGPTATCPCGNTPGGPGQGCNNSALTGGATLTDTGVPSISADTLVFTSTGLVPNTTCILIQGHVEIPPGIPYGDGLRCVGFNLLRMYVRTSTAGGVIAAPGPFPDPTVSARSAALGDPIFPGSERRYQVYYRDPGVSGCFVGTGATFNVSAGRRVPWVY